MIVNRTNITVRGRVISIHPLRTTSNASIVLNFRIAANERQYDPTSKTWADRDTFYISVTAWDGLARRLATLPMKNQMVVVMGTLATKSYEKDGVQRSYPELRAQHVAFDELSVEKLRPMSKDKDNDAGKDAQARKAVAGGDDEASADGPARPGAADDGGDTGDVMSDEAVTKNNDDWPETRQPIAVGADSRAAEPVPF